MTQADFTIANQTFPNTRAEINTSLQALATNSAGNSAPSTTFASQWWFDSDGNQLYIRNKDNDAWVKVFTIGATTDKIEELATDSLTLGGTTPTLTIGDGGAEDAKIIFDGNAQNFHIGLDDSADTLIIGVGNTLGTFPGITIDQNNKVTLPDGQMEIIVSGNYANLTLTTTDADDNFGPELRLYRNSASPANADNIGLIDFEGKDSIGDDELYARIASQINDKTNGAEDGILSLQVMIAGSIREGMRMSDGGVVINELSQDIDFRVEGDDDINLLFCEASSNRIGIGQGSPNAKLDVDSSSTSQIAGQFTASSASFGGDGITRIVCTRANTTAYEFMRVISGGTADIEYILRGDGNAFADGSWSGGGADYAEYFEWKDGNSSNEDRRGYSVILDGNKIVQATDSDDTSKIIGVISGNPAMVGDGAYTKWNDKYQKDDFGCYLRDQNGERILNTNYDETKDYVPRENRNEWDVVGLMGKLRLRKGQPTGTNWIKMRDISDSVEEWLVK